MFVRSLEVFGESNLHIKPAVDGVRFQIIEPLPGRSRQHEREVLDCHVSASLRDTYCLEVILEPREWFGYAVIGLDILLEAEAFRELRCSDFWAKAERS